MIAEPEYDVGATAALFTQRPVDLPGFLAPVVGFMRRRLLARYIRRYQRARALDMGKVRYYETLRCTWYSTMSSFGSAGFGSV